MRCVVRCFAQLRERLGFEQVTLELPTGACADAVFAHLFAKREDADQWRRYARIAVNRVYVSLRAPLHDGDEVAIIPPVAGG